MPFSESDKDTLLAIAERAIRDHLTGLLSQPRVSSSTLTAPGAVFVTLRKDDDLRGCIGTAEARMPLWQAVRDMAIAAAVSDPRFPPLSPRELPGLSLEISVLSPPKRIRSSEEIVVGRDGLAIRRGPAYGLLLPQVAPEYGWDRTQFLEHTCAKAGLPPDAWRDPDAELLTFTAEKFSRTLPA